MAILRSFTGTVTVELTSAEPEAALRSIQNAGISLYNLEVIGDLQIQMQIRRSDYNRIKALADKRGETLQILSKDGIYWKFRSLRKRPVLIAGLLLFFLFTLWVPGRIFFVRVEGNSSVPDNKIIEQALSCGIGFGASRREVRSERIKNKLLSVCPELQWAGVNTYGCLAIITVRERSVPEPGMPEKTVSSIVAVRDGIVGELTVLQGTALCKPGQAVQKGQVLVSGYTDCGIYIQAGRAEAEIYGLTQRKISTIYPTDFLHRGTQTHKQEIFSLIIGKNRINFAKDSGISGGSCAKIESEYCLTLPGGFQLPVKLAITQIISYDVQPQSTQDCQQDMTAIAENYVLQQMTAGSIRHCIRVFTEAEDYCRMDGIYECYEMLGTERKEESLG